MREDKHDLKVILFDLDGTLLDSRDFLVQSSYDILQKHYPQQFSYEQIEMDFGNGFARLLPDQVSDINVQALADFHGIKMEKYHETLYFPNVVKGLKRLYDMNIRLGVVTNQNKQVALNSLKHHGLESLFDVVIAHQDVKEGKPSPEGIFLAIEKLQCTKDEVIMVGDSRFDIMAGQNAGVLTGFIKWYDNLVIPKETPPDYVFYDFDSLLETILSQTNI